MSSGEGRRPGDPEEIPRAIPRGGACGRSSDYTEFVMPALVAACRGHPRLAFFESPPRARNPAASRLRRALGVSPAKLQRAQESEPNPRSHFTPYRSKQAAVQSWLKRSKIQRGLRRALPGRALSRLNIVKLSRDPRYLPKTPEQIGPPTETALSYLAALTVNSSIP